MKKILFIIAIPFLLSNCNGKDSTIDPIAIEQPEPNFGEPRFTGLVQTFTVLEQAEAMPDTFTVNNNLPNAFDLSPNMPPVLNQGEQKSAVAFATTYYLKSFQEKIQNHYEYLSNTEVMSPSFIYNQTKTNDNCNQGISIEDALYNLKHTGTTTWEEFPYSADNCTNEPTAEQLELANINKIESYHNVRDNSLTESTINIVKSLLTQNTPIIMGIKIDVDFKFARPVNDNDIYIYNENIPNSNMMQAVLIVGYDDDLNAFKFVNSWGTDWANDGYGYINYNFFIDDDTNPNYQGGVLGLYVAYDAL